MDTLLIIDDEKGLLEVLNVVFRKEGFEVKPPPPGPRGWISSTINRLTW